MNNAFGEECLKCSICGVLVFVIEWHTFDVIKSLEALYRNSPVYEKLKFTKQIKNPRKVFHNYKQWFYSGHSGFTHSGRSPVKFWKLENKKI